MGKGWFPKDCDIAYTVWDAEPNYVVCGLRTLPLEFARQTTFYLSRDTVAFLFF